LVFSKGLNKIDKLAKVTYSEGRKPKGLNKIDNMAKVTNTGRRNPKGPLWFSPSGIGDLSQFVYLVEPLWFSPAGIGELSQFVYLVEPLLVFSLRYM
jgi:hypothetical protein